MSTRSGYPDGKPRVLIVSPEAPWPMHGGGAIRTASLAEYFATRAALDMIVFRVRGRPEAPEPPQLLNALSWIEMPHHAGDRVSVVARNARRWVMGTPPLIDRFAGFERELTRAIGGQHYDLIIVEHFWCAPYVDLLRPACDEIWLDLHNVESEWHASFALRSSPAARAALNRFARRCRDLERALLPRFDLTLVPSERDAQTVAAIAGATPTLVYPNALPWIAAPRRQDKDEIVFTGHLGYQPNIDAVRFFHSRVWPLLRHKWPKLRWRIIGQNPDAIRRFVGDDARIDVVGPVHDAIAEIASAKVSVVPVLAGSGTRLKILEAWAAGTPVVSTTLGAQGLGATHAVELMIADQPDVFAETISGLLSSPDQRLSLSASGRGAYERRFTWNSAWRALAACPSAIVSKTLSLYTG